MEEKSGAARGQRGSRGRPFRATSAPDGERNVGLVGALSAVSMAWDGHRHVVE